MNVIVRKNANVMKNAYEVCVWRLNWVEMFGVFRCGSECWFCAILRPKDRKSTYLNPNKEHE